MNITFPLWAYFSITALLLVLLGWYMRMSGMCVIDLFTDPSGKLSHGKMWSNVAYVTMTAIVWRQGMEDKLSEEMALIYLAVIGGSEVCKKMIEVWKGKTS